MNSESFCTHFSRMFYAVQKGKETGVFLTWPECQAAIQGVSGAKYKKFAKKEEAEAFVSEGTKVQEKLVVKQTFAKQSSSEPDYYVYTDGACSNNGRVGSKAGIGIWFGEGDVRNVSQALSAGATNNVAELTAILRTHALIKPDLDVGKRVCIVSDSQYAIRCVETYGAKQASEGWTKDIPNKELVRRVYETYAGVEGVKFLYVAAHTEGKDRHSVGNAGADRLANLAIGVTECPYNKKVDSERVNLAVPYSEKEEAKQLGAKWDPSKKVWYCFRDSKHCSELIEMFGLA